MICRSITTCFAQLCQARSCTVLIAMLLEQCSLIRTFPQNPKSLSWSYRSSQTPYALALYLELIRVVQRYWTPSLSLSEPVGRCFVILFYVILCDLKLPKLCCNHQPINFPILRVMLGVSNVSKLHLITFVVQYHGGFLAIITYQCNDDMCI